MYYFVHYHMTLKTHAFSPPCIKLIENVDALNLGDSLLFQNQCMEYALL